MDVVLVEVGVDVEVGVVDEVGYTDELVLEVVDAGG